jgi:hypothetical protein
MVWTLPNGRFWKTIFFLVAILAGRMASYNFVKSQAKRRRDGASQLIDNAGIIHIKPDSISDRKAQFQRTQTTLVLPDKIVIW